MSGVTGGTFPDFLADRLGGRVLTIDAPGFGTESGRPSPRSIPAITEDIRERFAAVRGEEPWSMLVLNSRSDRLVSHLCSEAIARRLNLPLRVHATAGHDLPLDDPQWVAEQIADWGSS